MGINEFFYRGFMRLGCCGWFKSIILMSYFLSFFAYAEHVYTAENKAKIIARDLLEGAYKRTYPPSLNTATQIAHRTSLIRSIAKKATTASGLLYKKHPITGLAVTLGLGYVFDDLVTDAVDTTIQKFTSASRDESGRFYVSYLDSTSGQLEKLYIEEEPSIFNPIYIRVSSSGQDFIYSSSFSSDKKCTSFSFEQTLRCIAQISIDKVLERENSLPNISATEGKFLSYTPSPIYSDGYLVSYSYKRCILSSSKCFNELENFTIRLVKEKKVNAQVVPITDLFSKDKKMLTSDENLVGFYKNAVSLNSQDFTNEERQLISNMSASDLRNTFSDPSLTAHDLNKFKYSESMFDVQNGNANSSTSNPGGSVSPPVNGQNEDFLGEPKYPDLDIPSARDILLPFNQFFPSLHNFKLEKHSASCPTWSFDVLNHHFTLDAHCPLLEEQRQLIELVFSILWAFIALRHLLSA
ncbi:hypothetical protein [Pasteurella multocida]|uniref:hypothetical protein n=1 Tax=Pasteurella multocida TaxID=747 RepID=UPI00147B1DC9